NMNRVIMKALSVRIEDRYRNMGEMRADLYSPVREQKVGTPVAESRQVSAPVAASKQVATRSRKPLIIAVGLVAAVILAVVLIFSLRGSGDGSGGDTVTKDADKDTKTVADVRAMNEEPKSDTGYVRYGGKDIALADQAVAEDCFFGTYTCTDMEGDALPFEAAVRRQFSYTYESGKMKLTELPLKIEFGRGYYTNGSVLPFYYAVSDSELEECRDSLVRKYGKSDIDILEANYRISSRIYTAELYFGEKTGSSLQGRMLCKYSVTGETVHFTGITPRDDYSYDPNGFTLDVEYNFKGSHLLISADGKKVEMIPESETRRKDGDTTTVAIDAGALNKNQILDQIVYFHHMEKEGRDNEIMLVFEDGNRARDLEIRFDADGSFTISWKQIATTFDGKDQIVDSAGEVSGAYIGGCTRGMVLVVNDKAYAYTMPKAQYYYETLITE
ncbi:MAG: hypothetical protein IKM88_01290, partial [Lachnospiraceae bacterium]|nr:hypothetical protein [Lachnospiraceae bacterium]